jgi:hypothetical protein
VGAQRARTKDAERTLTMAKFIFLYRGPATPMAQFTPEQGAEQMAAWGAWMERVGKALVDGGSPFGARTAVCDDGTEAQASDQNGYTIVEAGGLDAAKGLLDGHPFLSEGKGRFTVDVYELLPM